MLELLLLTAALSTDNFAVSIGYGSSNTRISSGMTVLLNVFCSAALVASAQFGKSFLQFAEPEWGTRVCAGCFFLMGSLQMLRELKKRRRKKQGRKEESKGHRGKQISALEFGLLAVSMSYKKRRFAAVIFGMTRKSPRGRIFPVMRSRYSI